MNKSELIQDLSRVYTLLNKIPTKEQYDKLGKHSTSTMRRVFGQWSAALKEAFQHNTSPKTIKQRECLTCQTQTSNPKFCSVSCSTIFNNKNRITKHANENQNRCQCGKPINYRSKTCKLCVSLKDVPLRDLLYHNLHKSGTYSLIRSQARSKAEKLGWNSCIECGYNKHIQIAHVKAISSFKLDTLVSVINDESNLLPLCPNCHWEFDHGQKPHLSNKN